MTGRFADPQPGYLCLTRGDGGPLGSPARDPRAARGASPDSSSAGGRAASDAIAAPLRRVAEVEA